MNEEKEKSVGTVGEALKNLDKDQKDSDEVTGMNVNYMFDITGKKYKYSPVPISKYPEMHKLIIKLSDVGAVMSNLEGGGNDAAEIILMGILPNHPDMTLQKVKDSFDFSAYPRAIKLAINLNSFFDELKEIQGIVDSVGSMEK